MLQKQLLVEVDIEHPAIDKGQGTRRMTSLRAKPVKKVDVEALRSKFALGEDSGLEHKIQEIFEKQEENAGSFYSIVNKEEITSFAEALAEAKVEYNIEKKANCVEVVQTKQAYQRPGMAQPSTANFGAPQQQQKPAMGGWPQQQQPMQQAVPAGGPAPGGAYNQYSNMYANQQRQGAAMGAPPQ